MESDGRMGYFFKICEVISKMAYVNVLWILFTVLGLGVLGFMPATVALFTITRKWVMGESNVPIFKVFWQTFRKEFFKSTLLGIIPFVVGCIIYIDIVYMPAGGIYTILRAAIIFCTFLYILVLLYVLPTYVHYEWRYRDYIKNSLLMAITHMHYTLLMIVAIGGLCYILLTIPGLIPFFSVSILSYIIMWIAYQVIQKIEVSKVVKAK